MNSNFPYAGAMNLVFAPFVYRDNAKGKFVDSPLEEAVSSEPVSEAEIPC
jgi:hypothetical protein